MEKMEEERLLLNLSGFTDAWNKHALRNSTAWHAESDEKETHHRSESEGSTGPVNGSNFSI